MLGLNKPLIRWTIGDVDHFGFESLNLSINLMKKMYRDRFDYVVCHNELNQDKIFLLEKIGVNLYKQKKNCCGLPIFPKKINAWKLFPPRLRINSHEIFIDNDLILHKNLEEIESFIKSDKAMILGCTRPLGTAYGRFGHMVPEELMACSALFGLPPGLDAEKYFIKLLLQADGELHIFDEQGMVSALFASLGGIVIPEFKISNCWLGYRIGEYGIHFAGLNYGNSRPWRKHKMKMGMYI